MDGTYIRLVSFQFLLDSDVVRAHLEIETILLRTQATTATHYRRITFTRIEWTVAATAHGAHK